MSASVARGSLFMASGTVASRVLGVFRAALLASVIGVAATGDAFTTANTLPNVIYIVMAGGVLNSVLVPQLVKAAKSADGGEEYTSRLLTMALSMMFLVTVFATLLAPALVRISAGAFTAEQYRLSVAFAVICLPQIFFYGVYALLGQVLTARGRLLAFGWAPAFANLVAIAGLVAVPAATSKGHATRGRVDAGDGLAGSPGRRPSGIVAQALILRGRAVARAASGGVRGSACAGSGWRATSAGGRLGDGSAAGVAGELPREHRRSCGTPPARTEAWHRRSGVRCSSPGISDASANAMLVFMVPHGAGDGVDGHRDVPADRPRGRATDDLAALR
jgi:hypothetical protein